MRGASLCVGARVTMGFMDISEALKTQLAAKFGSEEPKPEKAPVTTAARLDKIVSKVTGKEDVATYADLDSLDRIEIAVRAEQEFGVKLGDEDVEKLKSVDDLARYIDGLLDDSEADAKA